MERLFLDLFGIVDSEQARATVHRFLRAMAIKERDVHAPALIQRLNEQCLAVHSAAMEALPRYRKAA
jgi:hypothetical protein